MTQSSGLMVCSAAEGLTRQFVIGGLLIVGLIVLGTVVFPWLRGRLHPSGRQADGTLPGTFSMEALEAMRRSGEIDEDEFRRLRRAALGLGVESPKTDNSASSRPAGGDDDDSAAQADGACADRSVEEESE